MILEGDIGAFPLREILELMVFSSVTGALEIETPNGPGRIYVFEGAIYHATYQNDIGTPAVWALFELTRGPFRFVAGEQETQRSISEQVSRLADEGEYRAQLWKPIRPYIPSLEMVPMLDTPSKPDEVRIDEETWAVMAMVNGERSVRQIANEMILEPLDVCNLIINLMKMGLVRMTGTAEPPRRGLGGGGGGLLKRAGSTSATRQQSGGGPSGGLLSRLMSALPPESEQPAAIPPPQHTPAPQHQPQPEQPPAPPPPPQPDPAMVEILRILREGGN